MYLIKRIYKHDEMNKKWKISSSIWQAAENSHTGDVGYVTQLWLCGLQRQEVTTKNLVHNWLGAKIAIACCCSIFLVIIEEVRMYNASVGSAGGEFLTKITVEHPVGCIRFREVQVFDKEFGIRILHATDGRYQFIFKAVKDTGKGISGGLKVT